MQFEENSTGKGYKCILKLNVQVSDEDFIYLFIKISQGSAGEVCQRGCSHFSSDSTAFSLEGEKNNF